MLKPIFFILALSFYAIPSFAFVNYLNASKGQLTNMFEGPASVALGGSGLAAKSPNESGHLNPATLPLLNGTHFGFIYGAESTGPRAGANKYHLVLAEANDEVAFPGSLTYSKVGVFKDGKDASFQELHGSMGVQVSDYLSFGLGLKYMTLEAQTETQVSAFNTIMGFLVAPHRNVGIALVFDDMLDTKDIPTNPTIGLGGQYVFDRLLRVRLDVVQAQKDNAGKKPIIKTGVESLFMGKDLNFRVGYRWDELRAERFFGTGLGWQGPNLGLNYAYEKSALSDDYRHLIDMLLQF